MRTTSRGWSRYRCVVEVPVKGKLNRAGRFFFSSVITAPAPSRAASVETFFGVLLTFRISMSALM